MQKTLGAEFVEAFKNKSYRGKCPVKDVPEKGIKPRDLPVAIKAVVALWQRKRSRAAKKVGRRGDALDAGSIYIREAEAFAVEYFMCNWLRRHFKLNDTWRITPCRGWQCTIRKAT